MSDQRQQLIDQMEGAKQEVEQDIADMKARHKEELSALKGSLRAIETGLRGLKGEPIRVHVKPKPEEAPRKGKKGAGA